MGQSLAIPRVIPNDWKRLDLIISKIKLHLGSASSQTFADLTLTGLTASSLLQTDANKKLTSIALPLIVANGGTGVATLTNHGILLGSGTGAITPLGVAANGQLPIGSAGVNPVLATLTEGEGVDITNAAGSITISGEDATDTNKGIASFNSLNMVVSSGAVDTVQNIDGDSAPAFGGIAIKSAGVGSILHEDFEPSTSSQVRVHGIDWWTQTFTATEYYQLFNVKLNISKYAADHSPGNVIVSIRRTDGSALPTGEDLCSASVNADGWSTTHSWIEFDFGAGTTLAAGTKYVIIVRAPDGDSDNSVTWNFWTDPLYGDGERGYSSDGGENWGVTTGDCSFQCYGTEEDDTLVFGVNANTGAITLEQLTASSLVATDANKELESVTIGTSLNYAGATLNAIQDIRTSASPTFVGGTFSAVVTGVTPTAGTHFATKEYVDLALGASKVFFLSDTGSGVGALNYAYPHETGQPQSTIVNDGLGEEYGTGTHLHKGFITEVGEPATTTLHAGVITIHLHAKKGASNHRITTLHAIISSVDADGTSNKNTIATSEVTAELTDSETEYTIHASFGSDVEVASTARLICDVYANVTTGALDSVVTMYMEGTEDCFFTARVDSGIWQNHGDVLDDLNTLGVAASDGQFIVATGAGAFAYEATTTARTSLGVGTGDSPQFTGIELGHASDTTITRVSAGVIAVEGVTVMMVGGAPGAHVHDGDTLEHNAVNSDGGAFAFNTTGAVTFNQSIILDTGKDITIAGHVIFNTNNSYIGFADPRLTFDDTNNLIQLTGKFTLPDAGYLGSASATTALQIEAGGDVVIAAALEVVGGVTCGVAITTRGTCTLSGEGAAQVWGGTVYLQPSADHDTDISAYLLAAYEDDFIIYTNHYGTIFTIAGADDSINIATILNVTGTITGLSTAAFEGASVTVGKASTTTGTIILHDSNSANTITLTVPDISAGSLSFTLPPTDGDNTNVLQTDGNGVLTWVAAGGGTDEKVKIDSLAAAGYIGAANNDGVLRTGSSLSYTDGGDFVTINTLQDLRTQGKPTFGGLILDQPLYLLERPSAAADVAGKGQFWVKDDAPCTPWFTDDAGNDIPLYPQDLTASDKPTFGGLILDQPLYLLERGAAAADVANKGQIWVKDDTPNTLWFTNDDGTDFLLYPSDLIADADNDTKVQVEESSDEDIIRFDTVGNERMRIDADGIITYNLQSGAGIAKTAAQAIVTGTWTKVQFETEDFDNQNEYDDTVEYRFTAKVAGLYLVSALVNINEVVDGSLVHLAVRRNGVRIAQVPPTHGSATNPGGNSMTVAVSLAATDYVEIWVYHTVGVNKNVAGNGESFVSYAKIA